MASIPKHGDPVRNPLKLVDPVGDIDDADAPGLEARYQSEQYLRLAIGQRCGRLVQDEDTQVAAHRLGDLYELLFAARQLRDGPVEIDAAFERREERFGSAASLAPPQEAERRRLLAENEILEDGLSGDEGEFLEYCRDSRACGRSAP